MLSECFSLPFVPQQRQVFVKEFKKTEEYLTMCGPLTRDICPGCDVDVVEAEPVRDGNKLDFGIIYETMHNYT